MRPIAELNQLSAPEFAEALQPLFETAAPLAHALYAERPFSSYEALLERAERIVEGLSLEQQTAILSAHPRIGERADAVSALSYREQGYDAEAGAAAGEVRQLYATLAELNAAYEARYGFRFVVFVNKRPRSEIVKVLRERLENSKDQEIRTGLRDVFSIARDRLASLRAGDQG